MYISISYWKKGIFHCYVSLSEGTRIFSGPGIFETHRPYGFETFPSAFNVIGKFGILKHICSPNIPEPQSILCVLSLWTKMQLHGWTHLWCVLRWSLGEYGLKTTAITMRILRYQPPSPHVPNPWWILPSFHPLKSLDSPDPRGGFPPAKSARPWSHRIIS